MIRDGTANRRPFVRLNALAPDAAPGMYPDGLELDRAGRLYIGQYTASQILVVSSDGASPRTIEVPSPAAPNLGFDPSESVNYVTAVDDVADAPWCGKVYAVPNHKPVAQWIAAGRFRAVRLEAADGEKISIGGRALRRDPDVSPDLDDST